MFFCMATKFGYKEAGIISFQVINGGHTIYVPGCFFPLPHQWVVFTPEAEGYEDWKALLEKLNQGETVDFYPPTPTTPQRWLIAPLPESYQKILKSSLVIDWPADTL